MQLIHANATCHAIESIAASIPAIRISGDNVRGIGCLT